MSGGSSGLPGAAGGTRPALGICTSLGMGTAQGQAKPSACGGPQSGDPVARQRTLRTSIIGAGTDIPEQGLKWHPGQHGGSPGG